MAVPRVSSFKALQTIQKVSRVTVPKRGLHLTERQDAPRLANPMQNSGWIAMGLQDLQNEARKRTLSATGTKHELIDRINGHDALQARAFSIALKRIAVEQTSKRISGPADTAAPRHFNTSHELKAVGDLSTIDFCYLPKLFEERYAPEPTAIRVPILPHVESDDAEARLEEASHLDHAAGGYQDTDKLVNIMKPEISTMLHNTEQGVSPMSDVHDGHHPEMTIEMLTQLNETVSKSAKKLVEGLKDKDEDSLRRIWNGFLDDLLGRKGTPKTA